MNEKPSFPKLPCTHYEVLLLLHTVQHNNKTLESPCTYSFHHIIKEKQEQEMIRKVLLTKYSYQKEENSSNPSRRLSKQSSQRRTRLSLKRMKQDSSLFLQDETSSDTTNDISSRKDINLSNLKLGDMIDRGCFSSVHDIQYDIKGNKAISNVESSSVQSSRDDFVIKRARPSLSWDARIESIVSLAKEAQFLAQLSHEHIINMEGTIGDPGKQHRIITFSYLESIDLPLHHHFLV